jgi:hypothetical protein
MVMIKKPKFIKRNEKTLGVLSSLQINFPDDSIFKFLNGRSFEVVWSQGLSDIHTGTGKIIVEKIIFKTKQGFYLYLLMNTTNVNLLVYYKQNQESELTIFITQLLKQFKNDKTINE